MTKAISAREKFQQLLRELFQFDCADLDFGIYRIMNHRRAVIEKFISEDLLDLVGAELQQGALAEQAAAAKELPKVVREVGEILGYEAMDADGNLRTDYEKTPLGQRYLAVRERSLRGLGREEVEAELFNHLFAFFRRYYQDGDFIPQNRYAHDDRYVIPYNGEEVVLHWANRNQYYVKSTERFHSYAFVSAGVSVRFSLRSASLEHGDVKGAPRYFVPLAKEVTRDEQSSPPSLTIPFDYRPLTSAEAGDHNGAGAQDAILESAATEIVRGLDDAPALVGALTVDHSPSQPGESVTALRHHLRQYTRRNTSDFFIHQNLERFLTWELDFFLKNEVVRIEDLEAAGVNGVLRWLHKVRVLRVAAERVIKFLGQLESFQKVLWEKRKFVTETHYCIAVGQIPEHFHQEIAVVDAQWAEWEKLCHLHSEGAELLGTAPGGVESRLSFLARHPSLLLDTKHFGADFADRVLASFNDLSSVTDGLIVQSQNYHALRFLQPLYKSKVRCVYIDPPYNTDASAIIYKNGYKDSTWLALIENGLAEARPLLSKRGILCCAIDDEEAWRLRALMQRMLGRELGIVPVRTNPAGRKSSEQFSPSHEYSFFFGAPEATPSSLPKSSKERQRYPYEDGDGRYAWNSLIRHGSGDRRADRPTKFYPIYVGEENSLRIPQMEWDGVKREYRIMEPPADGEVAVWPVKDGIEKRWHRAWERVQNDDASEYRVRRHASRGVAIDFKIRMDTRAMPRTWWDDARYASANYGAKVLKDLFGEKPFDFAKAVGLVADCVRASGGRPDTIILDYFAGSGTTGHAVIDMNREDDGRRKFILVEMGNHVDAVLLPRLKKIAFAPEWKDGRPKRPATAEEAERGPRVIKYLRLESYEDTLDNITFDDAAGQRALGLKDYLLEYMLKWETKQSSTMLNVEQLASPFTYRLRRHRNGDTAEKPAQVAETFNYLLGLRVETRRVHHDDNRRYLVYTGSVDGRRVAVIWRDTVGWGEREMARDAKFVAQKGLADGMEEVFMNSPTLVRKANAIEPVFKKRMFASVES